MLVENEDRFRRYRGMNPDFVRRVMEKRKQEEKQRQAQEAARREAEAMLAEAGALKRLQGMRAKAAIEKACEHYRQLEVKTGRKSVKQIIFEVALQHGVRPSEVTGSSRNRDIVKIRHEAIWLARQLRPDLSLPALGRQFGGRDHTTILHALNKMAALHMKEAA